MLHSFWFGAGEQVFRNVLAKDPTCAIAYWGIASLLMLNPLSGVGPLQKDAEKAQAMIELARQIPTKPHELAYIEAVGAYYEDWANRKEPARQEVRSRAYEALAARYPDDDEAQIFSALYIAATQSQADQTYAAYARAAARSWRNNLPNIPITLGSRTISFIHTTRPRSPPGALPLRAFTPASRLTRHMRCTCRRISSRGWAPGKTRHRPIVIEKRRRRTPVCGKAGVTARRLR
jgi:hypothetical protein